MKNNNEHCPEHYILLDAARDNLQAEGPARAVKVQQGFTREYEFAQGMARQVMQLRTQTETGLMPPRQLRQELIQMMRDAIASHPQALELFIAFEPDALDGHDADFIAQRTLGSNDSGRFALN